MDANSQQSTTQKLPEVLPMKYILKSKDVVRNSVISQEIQQSL